LIYFLPIPFVAGIFFFIGQADRIVEESALLRQQVEVITSLSIAACVITIDSKIRAWNEGCVSLWGYTPNEVLNQEIDLLMPLGELRGRHLMFVKNFAEGKKKLSDSLVVGRGRKVTGRHKNGTNISVMLFVTERKDETVTLYTGIFHSM
jgi:PAS domain S-box-containing protein